MSTSKTIAKKSNFKKCLKLVFTRLTAPFCLLFLFNYSVFAYSQRPITLKLKSVDMATAISEIEKNSDYRFVLNNNIIPGKKVSINVRDAELPAIMSQLLSATDLSYKVMENNLVVIFDQQSAVADIIVTGKVTNESGGALEGA